MFTSGINYLIEAEIRSLRDGSDGSTKQLLGDMESILGGIHFGKEHYLNPDVQVAVIGQTYCPGIAIEVAWSETVSQLSNKAQTLFAKSGGLVQVVVGLKSTPPGADNLTAHVWRYGAPTVVEGQILDRGTIYPGSIRIKLKEVAAAATLACYPKANLDTELVLDYKQLAKCFLEAKKWHIASKLRTGGFAGGG